MRARLAWTLFSLTCLCAVVQVSLLVVSGTTLASIRNVFDGFPLVTLGAVAGAGTGAVVVSRYPRHRVGWLLVVGQLGTALGLAAQTYRREALGGELGSAPGGHFAIWLSIQTGAIFAVTLLAALFLLASDGHLLSRRWRWAMVVAFAGLVSYWVAMVTVSPSRLDGDGVADGGNGLVKAFLLTGTTSVLVALLAGTVSLVRRLRRASGEERQHLTWLAAAGAGMAGGAAIAVLLQLLELAAWVTLPLMVAYVCVPVFTGIAILRFRLYDIDVIVSRAIVLSVLTATVATGYIVIVVVIGEIVGSRADASFWPSLLATAAVAVSVQPLRRRVTLLADRVVYGDRAAPYVALADFSKELHESPANDELLPRVAEAVGGTVGAAHVYIWVDVPGKDRTRFGWPDREEHVPDLVLPVRDSSDELGGLSVSMPPWRPLRPDERQLLQDFSVQLARAFRNLRLQSELEDRIDDLTAQGEELSASRRRLVSAQEAGRRRFEAAIRSKVLPHIESLPDELDAMGAQAGCDAVDPAAIERMINGTNRALDALRTLTRGVFPAQLTNRGLVSTLSSQLRLAGFPGLLHADDSVPKRRLVPDMENAAYFCVFEFLRELDPPKRVTVTAPDGCLVIEVTGGSTATVETETRHLADRVAPLGGGVRIEVLGSVAALRVEIPLVSEEVAPAKVPQAAGVV